jgi:hypothetical protein
VMRSRFFAIAACVAVAPLAPRTLASSATHGIMSRPMTAVPTVAHDSGDSVNQHTSKPAGIKKSSKGKTKGSSKTHSAEPKKVATPPAPAFTVTPLPDAILPKKRIIAFYGNPLSKRMGVLGEYPESVMLAKLQSEVEAFNKADPTTPAIPALHLIVTVAQGSPGKKGLYRLRMTDSLIEHWCKLAERKGYLMFLDVQVGRSTVQSELQPLMPYLQRPYVHLALDPEFAMKGDKIPGRKIGTMDASEVNYAIQTLANLVTQYHLPPKILVVHRFTQNMLTRYREIRPVPSVQVVINMDGFGAPWLKHNSYHDYIEMQPVQFTGFKLFYKNDKPMLSRSDVVKLTPSPVFITFQ